MISLREEWISALQSGNWNQGPNVLFNPKDNTYCCLGVLCDLAHKRGLCPALETFSTLATEEIPENVMTEVDLTEDDCTGLAEYNDSGATFKQIAHALSGVNESYDLDFLEGVCN